jgi:adenosine kinase
MALLGQRPGLWATVGEDFSEYRQRLEAAGVDTSGARVIPGVFTASYFVTTDRSNAQIASFYPGAMAFAGQFSLKELEVKPDLVVISPNDPGAMERFVGECHALDYAYIYDPSQQIVRMQAAELRQGIVGALALVVNDYEFALVRKMTGMGAADILGSLRDDPRAFMVVTRGEKGATVFARQAEVEIPVVPPQYIADPTGVGDAFRGGFLTAYLHGFDWETCGRTGALAATYCLENKGPQGHTYTPAEFVTRFRTQFDDHGKLNSFIQAAGD